MSHHVVIIGAGQAGIQAAATLRGSNFEGHITVISDEIHAPYQKPPLSKDFLKDKMKEANLLFRPEAYYEKKDINLKLGQAVTAIHPENSSLELTSGEQLNYDHLIIATGSRNRHLPVPGSDAEGVFYLRDLSESQSLKEVFTPGKSIVVIGGGFIGLEIAATARSMGLKVTVIEMADRLMARVLPEELSDRFKAKHIAEGVEVLTGCSVKALKTKDGQLTAIALNNGEVIPTDYVIVGIGVVPNVELAEAAGIKCDDGIMVDQHMKTSHPNIYAIGDCAHHYNPFFDRFMRLESVQNAMDQAKVAVQSIIGQPIPYEDVPWFWTHQYDWKLQMAGSNLDYTSVVRRGEGDQCSWFYFRGTKLTGVDSLNRGADHIAAKKLLQAGVSPTAEQIADPDFNLKSLLK